jgi:hypothetical protein
MADTAATVNEITTHFFGDAMARDLGGSHYYGVLDAIPRAMDTRGALLSGLDDALGQVADASTPRAPVDVLPFLRVNDEQRPPKPNGGALWEYPNKEEAEQERVWLDDDTAYDSDATLAIEGDYAFATEAERTARHHLLRAPVESAAPAAAASAAVSVRVCLEWQPKMLKTWPSAVPSARKANKKNAKKERVPKKLRVALPVGVLDNDEEATLAHGMLVKGMAGGKARRAPCAPQGGAPAGARDAADGQGDRGRDQQVHPHGRAAAELWAWRQRRRGPHGHGQGGEAPRGEDHGRAGPPARAGERGGSGR